ncbi:LysR family transcriptional regulator [Paludibacterium sp. B53371]|uniref:LysR family transcriptional regulator n=1 Tax=Paludibacterium sp. B53371 TaxID=2806263 RepID=UPI001C055BAA|nr:LysR family transcriptional regulator [Paludibacterium sp. B53371]
MINPLWLRSFRAVVQHGNYTRAAEQLDLTQAAISQHMARLESATGSLFVRQGRSLELTPRGQALLDYSQELDIATHRLQQRLSSSGPLSGPVSLAVPGSVGLKLYPALLAWQCHHPAIRIDMRFAPEPGILSALLAQEVELGIVTLPPSDSRLHRTLLGQEALCLVLPASSQASRWQDLVDLGWIGHPDGVAMASRWLARAFPGKQLADIPQRGFINQIGMILQPVARGLGFAILPQYAVQAFPDQQAIRLWPLPQPVSDNLWLLRRREWPLSRAAALAAEQLQQRLA